jgi:hypothetical protein
MRRFHARVLSGATCQAGTAGAGEAVGAVRARFADFARFVALLAEAEARLAAFFEAGDVLRALLRDAVADGMGLNHRLKPTAR